MRWPGFDAAIYGNEVAGINVQLAAGTVVAGAPAPNRHLAIVEWISATDFNDILQCRRVYDGTDRPLPNAGSAGVDGFR